MVVRVGQGHKITKVSGSTGYVTGVENSAVCSLCAGRGAGFDAGRKAPQQARKALLCAPLWSIALIRGVATGLSPEDLRRSRRPVQMPAQIVL